MDREDTQEGKRGSSDIRSIEISICSYPPELMEREATITGDRVTRQGKVEGGTEAVKIASRVLILKQFRAGSLIQRPQLCYQVSSSMRERDLGRTRFSITVAL